MTDKELLDSLDAYGHLNWTVGNEDWIACFDYNIDGDRLAYCVVVDCESGGFIDTLEKAIIPLAEWEKLVNLPSYWADIACEVGGGIEDWDDYQKVLASWNESLRRDVERATKS